MAEIPPTRPSLLVRLRDPRDQVAWSQFAELYAPLVYNYARQQGLQDADAADLSQDVLGAVVGAVGRLEYDPARGAFRNWLFTIVRRKLSNSRRARKSRPQTGIDSEILQSLEPSPEPKDDVSWLAEWERRTFAWACDQVRREVTEVTWLAFWRTTVEGQPGKQVASVLGVSVVSVYHARSRVRARLKELIQSARES